MLGERQNATYFLSATKGLRGHFRDNGYAFKKLFAYQLF
jgi:hypothetical protein